MMDAYTQKVLGKIKKCFALSQSANPHEAAIALKQAHALIKKFNLEYKVEELARITHGKKISAGNQLKLPLYLAELLNLINHIFASRSLIHIERVSDSVVKSSIEFYGWQNDVTIAEYAWEVLSTQLIRSRTQFLNQKTAGRTNKTNKALLADYYCLGWIASVYQEVKNLSCDTTLEQQAAHAKNISDYQAMLYNEALKPAKIKGSSIGQTVSSKEFAAYQKGNLAGKQVALGKGLNSTILASKGLNSTKKRPAMEL